MDEWLTLLKSPSFITALGALILSAFTAWAVRDRYSAEVKSEEATAASILTGAALAQVEGLERTVCRLNLRIEKQDEKIESQDKKILQQEIGAKKQNAVIIKMRHQMEIQKDFIQYLWLGIVSLTDQLEKNGMIPEFKPERNFRGSDDFDDEDWAWLGNT